MKYKFTLLALIALGVSVPAYAEHVNRKDQGERFDSAVISGGATVYGASGPKSVSRAITSGCVTQLYAGKDIWEIDWTTSTIENGTPGTKLDITMGRPDVVFSLQFGDGAKLRSALAPARALDSSCK